MKICKKLDVNARKRKVDEMEHQVRINFKITGHVNTFIPVGKHETLEDRLQDKINELRECPSDILELDITIDDAEVE